MQVSPTNPTMVYLRLGFNLVCQDLALQLRRPRRRPKRRRRQRPKQPLWLHLVCQKWPRKLWMRWRLRSAMVSVILNCNIWYHWSIYYTYIYIYIYPPQPFQALQYANIFLHFSEVVFWKRSFRMSRRFSWNCRRTTSCVPHWVPTKPDSRNIWMSTLAEFSHEPCLENLQNPIE